MGVRAALVNNRPDVDKDKKKEAYTRNAESRVKQAVRSKHHRQRPSTKRQRIERAAASTTSENTQRSKTRPFEHSTPRHISFYLSFHVSFDPFVSYTCIVVSFLFFYLYTPQFITPTSHPRRPTPASQGGARRDTAPTAPGAAALPRLPRAAAAARATPAPSCPSSSASPSTMSDAIVFTTLSVFAAP